jgi:hypothetical protein
MDTSVIATAILALVMVVYIFARQMMQRPVTQRDLLAPLILGVALGGVFLVSSPALEAAAAVGVGALFGVGTGLVSGQFMRIWRDKATGLVYQRGGWRYLVAIVVLLLARVLIRFVFIWTGAVPDETALNDAFIAALVGNYLGRSVRVALRALPLAGGSFEKLPSR